MNYEKLLQTAYSKYKKEWCDERGYLLSEYDPETGFNGECFVCLAEFEDCEFQDESYMENLLTYEQFIFWKGRDRFKDIMAEHRIKMMYSAQVSGRITVCPRCGASLDPVSSHNALSRRIDVYICSDCGMLEAFEDAGSPKLELRDWDIAKPVEEDAE